MQECFEKIKERLERERDIHRRAYDVAIQTHERVGYASYARACDEAIEIVNQIAEETNKGEISDGYHTFNELYHHRAILFSVICNSNKELAWKSRLHDTGDMYDGMFIVGIETPEGQATYHYDIEPYWDMFEVKKLQNAPKWDGHTPDEAIRRIGLLGKDINTSSNDGCIPLPKVAFDRMIARMESESERDIYEEESLFINVRDAARIVHEIAEEYKHGHFGCNSNGQHEKCKDCGLRGECSHYNTEWFGGLEIPNVSDVPDKNVGENDRWIPCSERLPKNYETVNITWANRNPVSYYAHIKDKPYTGTAIYFYGKWYWYSCVCEDYLKDCGDSTADRMDKDIEVLAWQPLPAPYQPKGE